VDGSPSRTAVASAALLLHARQETTAVRGGIAAFGLTQIFSRIDAAPVEEQGLIGNLVSRLAKLHYINFFIFLVRYLRVGMVRCLSIVDLP
jgi:hypothetical protein